MSKALKAATESWLKWVDTFRLCFAPERKKWVALVLDGVREFGTSKDKKHGEKIYDELTDTKKYELVGVIPHICYMKVNGDKEELSSMFLHPTSQPTLLYYMKDTCCFVIINPALRYNKSVLMEVGQKEKIDSIVGISS